MVFEPPPPKDILPLMAALEGFIHEPSTLDHLTKMALVHHQFETIHPFYDGEGRSGRILHILSLVQEGPLDAPFSILADTLVITNSANTNCCKACERLGTGSLG